MQNRSALDMKPPGAVFTGARPPSDKVVVVVVAVPKALGMENGTADAIGF